MQPRELVIEGLTSFTGRVHLDFSDVGLFALVGPTGAGKSSVIDAITLALYGRIPRLHANEIAPAIASTANECTVGLTFTVRGRPHRAVRTIRRTRTGASTIEAVLEQLDVDGQVVATVAGTAEDLTAEVERLIGLTFNEFTRAVVLPQGQFAKVLRAQPKERQTLLSRLLGVSIYDRVKQRAGAHARSAQERAEQTAHQIHQLGAVDADQIERLRTRLAELDTLIGGLTTDAEALQQIRDTFRDHNEQARQAADLVARTKAITPPPEEVREFADRVARADDAISKARATLADVEKRVDAVEKHRPASEELTRLQAILAQHQRTPERLQAVETASGALAEATDELAQVEVALTRARTDLEKAITRRAAAHRDHAAVQAVIGLEAGDDCPVCAGTLDHAAPALQAADDGHDALGTAEEAVAEATRRVGTLEAQQRRAVDDRRKAEQAKEQAAQAVAAHRDQLRGQPEAETITARLSAAAEMDEQLAGLRTEARHARDDLDKAVRDRGHLEQQGRGLAGVLDRQRLAVAQLEPPATTGDVVADWEALHRWARASEPALVEAEQRAQEQVAATRAEGSALRERMDRACAAAGVPDSQADPRDRAVQYRAETAAECQRLEKVLEMADNLRAEESDARAQAEVGAELARLLRTDQFQRWLLDEATQALVAGASQTLRSLSSGRYELSLDGRNGSIEVRDLASAAAPRSVRTLSGGETFLASLALALSLAEQIASSAAGPVALESLFIDEGFGALDPETLDIAAGAIEQLGATDRTVGVITHVTEMADRLPTRFVVSRGAAGSDVTRVDL